MKNKYIVAYRVLARLDKDRSKIKKSKSYNSLNTTITNKVLSSLQEVHILLLFLSLLWSFNRFVKDLPLGIENSFLIRGILRDTFLSIFCNYYYNYYTHYYHTIIVTEYTNIHVQLEKPRILSIHNKS